MAIYELTFNGISDNPFRITFEADDENEKQLALLTCFSEILDKANELQLRYNSAGHHWSVNDISGVDQALIEEKFYEAIGRFLKPKLELISTEKPQKESGYHD